MGVFYFPFIFSDLFFLLFFSIFQLMFGIYLSEQTIFVIDETRHINTMQ